MANLSKQVLVYSVSTDSFFSDKENNIATVLMNIRVEKKELLIIRDNKKSNNKEVNLKLNNQINEMVSQSNKDKLEVVEDMLNEFTSKEKELSGELNALLEANNQKVRTLRYDALFTTRSIKDRNGNVSGKEINKSNKVVALFESSFTRTLGLDSDHVNENVVIVKAYHYKVLEDLIHNGFQYNNEEYVFFSASSGQMKNKKAVFVMKSLWNKHKNTLLCGLDWERINKTKIKDGYGININKMLAYLSLQNTATTKWTDFDIDRVVVCPDLEVDVTDTVEYIDRDTYEIFPPEKKTLPMNVSDGVGLILPELSKKNFQFRIPWGKGLLSSYDFRKHAESIGKYKITDVWGGSHDIDKVDIILSASQLKTWKYYKNMKEYRQFFKDYNCEAGKCNEEVETNYIQSNYQYLQSLEMDKSKLDSIARATNYDIYNIGSDQSVMLRSLGATQENEKKNYFQQALLMYPNLLNDSHAKEMIKSKKSSMVEDAKAGTLRLEGKRMFVLPDLHAYCGFLLTGDKNAEGLLDKNEVFAKNIKVGTVDLMRSPQLYREHAIAESVKNDKLEEWFTTGGIYISNRDFISRLLQLDFDGDTINVCVQNDWVKAAKRNMEGIYPLYYEMSVAPVQKISEDSIYRSLELSFGSSIGSISNDITKIWNSAGKMTDEKLKAIKLLTMYNNFMIDYSKTNFLPKPVGKAKKLIRKHTRGDMPYFFQWAKNKDKVANKVVEEYIKVKSKNGKVYKLVKSQRVPVVNMLDDIINDKRITFKSVADSFDYKMLMNATKINEKNPELNEVIIKAYAKVNKSKKWLIDKDSDDYKENKYIYVARVMKEEIIDAARTKDGKVSDVYVADVLVHHLHEETKTRNKKTLWEAFGDIVLANLEKNLAEAVECEDCNKMFRKAKRKTRCIDCQTKKDRENARLRKQKQRKAVK
nr:hypothetical protein 3 [Bacillaceae bacterium]